MPEDFSDGFAAHPTTADAFVVDVDGFEGPLDLLLSLARTQKVDLRRVSILGLAEQYLSFVDEAKRLRIELAADYLVMAAWLAYLKSRLLLPPDPSEEGPTGEELAAHLAFQLQRLEAMRRVAAQLMARDQLNRDFFPRGMSETVTERKRTVWTAGLVDLMRGYAGARTREDFAPLKLKRGPVYTVEAALERLRGLIGTTLDWTTLEAWLPEAWRLDPEKRRSATASTFVAMLELARRGDLELRQDASFAPIEVRGRGGGDHGA
ncbi:MAG: ScpA family protein [Pseudomonadota bacterium]